MGVAAWQRRPACLGTSCPAGSLRVAVVTLVVILGITFAVVFVFLVVFFFIGLLSQEDFAFPRALRKRRGEQFRTCRVHASWYAFARGNRP